MRALLDPQVRIIEAESLPYGGEKIGIDALLELIPTVFKTWKSTAVTVSEFIADGDCVVVLATMTATGKATGTQFSMPIAEVWRLANGRIIEVRPFYFDTRVMCDAYGG